eukprot:1923592-Rhodomonas_salina.5
MMSRPTNHTHWTCSDEPERCTLVSDLSADTLTMRTNQRQPQPMPVGLPPGPPPQAPAAGYYYGGPPSYPGYPGPSHAYPSPASGYAPMGTFPHPHAPGQMAPHQARQPAPQRVQVGFGMQARINVPGGMPLVSHPHPPPRTVHLS